MLGRFNEDLAQLQRAVRNGDGQTLFDLFTRTRAIRRAIIDIGQDTAAPNFGRLPFQLYVAPEPEKKKRAKASKKSGKKTAVAKKKKSQAKKPARRSKVRR
jgi:hypothetical protein